MNLRTRLTRALVSSPAPARPARPDAHSIRCHRCPARADRQPDGDVPRGWFRFLSGELLCPACLQPTLDAVRRGWQS